MLASHGTGCVIEITLYSSHIVIPRPGLRWRLSLASRRPTGFLQCFDTVGLVIWPVKIVPEMTYIVFSGTLSLYTTTTVHQILQHMHVMSLSTCSRFLSEPHFAGYLSFLFCMNLYIVFHAKTVCIIHIK